MTWIGSEVILNMNVIFTMFLKLRSSTLVVVGYNNNVINSSAPYFTGTWYFTGIWSENWHKFSAFYLETPILNLFVSDQVD